MLNFGGVTKGHGYAVKNSENVGILRGIPSSLKSKETMYKHLVNVMIVGMVLH